jgi:hypothetical protein
MQIDAKAVLQYIQGIEKENKNRYLNKKITLAQLQADYKQTNRIKEFILFLTKTSLERD